ncbi:MAG: hypothetical protein R3253_10415, partial [Longimicrobiales bacterium]|nr:hypothetical protein [Longimicrobiales bacterium]
GSNTFNILTIMGFTAVISPADILVSNRMLFLDIPFMLITSGVIAFSAMKVRPLGRKSGVIMLVTYVTYLATLAIIV